MKLLKPTLVAIALVSVFGCQQETKKEATKAPVLETQIQKQAYGLGASIGTYMERNLKEHEKLGLALDRKLLEKGFEDSLSGKSLLQKDEIQTLLTDLDKTMKEKQQAMNKVEAEKSLTEGEKYLADNAKKPGVKVTASGLQYEVITQGTGEKPKATDVVKVNYKGTFINGDKFDSSYDRHQPAVFPLNRVIPGWTEGVQLMPVGSKYRFVIPSKLAYGPVGNPPRIAGNSVLVFEIELLAIQKPAEPAKVGDK